MADLALVDVLAGLGPVRAWRAGGSWHAASGGRETAAERLGWALVLLAAG